MSVNGSLPAGSASCASPRRDRARGILTGLAALAVPLAFYSYTMAPTIGTGDTAILLDAMRSARVTTHVNNHPLTVLVGWLFGFLPFSDVAAAGNFVSVVFGSLSVAVFFALVLRATASRVAAAVAAAVLMVSHAHWWHATIVENYCFNALLTSCYLGALVEHARTRRRSWLLGACFIAGLGLFNHVQMAFFAVGGAASLTLASLAEWRSGPRRALGLFAGGAAAYLAGMVPWTALFIRDWRAGGDFPATLRSAFFGTFQHVMLGGSYFDGALDFLRLVLMQVPSAFLAAVAWGLVAAARRWRWSAVGVGIWTPAVLTAGFFMSYDTWDKFAFLLPVFVTLIFMGGVGLADARPLWERGGRLPPRAAFALVVAASLAAPPLLYGRIAPRGERGEQAFFEDWSNTATANTHRASEYIANPNKHGYYDVDVFIRELFATLPLGATYVDDDSRLYYPVEFYQRHYALRPDLRLHLVNSWDIPGWGLSRAAFAELMQTAHDRDREFFIVTTSPPFASLTGAGLSTARFRFDRFPLGGKRWIYRLRTAREEALAPAAPPQEKRLRIQPGVRTEALPSAVAAVRDGAITEQPMAIFGPLWHRDNQLFVTFQKEGASLELALESGEDVTASLAVDFTTAPDFGIVRILVNGVPVGLPVNLYSRTVRTTTWRQAGVRFGKGVNALTVEVLGKDKRSSAHYCGIDSLLVE